MGSTSRFALSYPELTEAPNGPAQIQELAGDVDGWLCRAFRCTSATRPTGVPNDFLIRESDTGNIMIWTGSAWAQVSGNVTGGGGGGGGTATFATASATYAASAAQPISDQTDVVVAFPTALLADGAVTRNIAGGGHSFTLNQTRLWTVTATVRFAAHTDAGGRTVEIRAGSAVFAKDGDGGHNNAAWTRTLSNTRKLAAGTVITVVARHDAGTGLALEPNAGQYVHIDLAGV